MTDPKHHVDLQGGALGVLLGLLLLLRRPGA
jgi:hypothetical protein